MTSRTFRLIAAVAVGLVLLLVVLRSLEDHGAPAAGRTLLPDFAAAANDIHEIRILGKDPSVDQSSDESADKSEDQSEKEPNGVTLRRNDTGWVVVERDAYPADLGKLRQLVIAMSEASIVEEKTSNPEYYERLGLDDPANGGDGLQVTATGDGFEATVIFGTTAQGDFRYARLPDQPTSYLVDRNPALPLSPGEWLEPEIIDVSADEVRLVTIEHADGERIELAKPDGDDEPNMIAVNLPEGRELSYASVGDSIAGVLGKLELDEVRPATDAGSSGSARFETAGGLIVDVQVIEDVVPGEAVGDKEDESPANADETEDEIVETSETWLRFSVTAGEEAGDDAGATATAVNDRVTGWEYRVPDYKVQLLTKRWDDLLKAP